MSTNIELAKTRDFGEVIGDTFLFIRENFVPLIKCFFIFCGFFLIATIVIAFLQQSQVISYMNTANSDSYSADSGPIHAFSKLFGLPYFLSIIFGLFNYTAITLTVISYMAVYKSKGNLTPTVEEVWAYIKYYFFKTLGCIVLVGIMLCIGLVCCVIPFFYLYPILSLIFPIMIIENASFGYSFSQSFRLIKENWWSTFGALIVIGIVVYVILMAVLLPLGAANIGSMFLHRGKGVHLSPTLLYVSTIISTLCHVFYILPLVTITLCYFNLTELKDAPGLMDRINQLGNNDADTNLPTEEY